eukprot:3647028-Rhodomonas_salina.1
MIEREGSGTGRREETGGEDAWDKETGGEDAWDKERSRQRQRQYEIRDVAKVLSSGFWGIRGVAVEVFGHVAVLLPLRHVGAQPQHNLPTAITSTPKACRASGTTKIQWRFRAEGSGSWASKRGIEEGSGLRLQRTLSAREKTVQKASSRMSIPLRPSHLNTDRNTNGRRAPGRVTPRRSRLAGGWKRR